MAQRVDRWVSEDGIEHMTEEAADAHTKESQVRESLTSLFAPWQAKMEKETAEYEDPWTISDLVRSFIWEIQRKAPQLMGILRSLPYIAKPPYSGPSEPVAFFDKGGQIQGRVSDEQLEVLCVNALSALKDHSGGVDCQEQRELSALGNQLRTTNCALLKWSGETYEVPDWVRWVGEDNTGHLYMWSDKPTIDDEGSFVTPVGVMCLVVASFDTVHRVKPLLVSISEAA